MNSISRRSILRAAGAGALAAPFAKPRHGGALAGAPATKRLVVFWTPNGSVQDQFWPTGSGTNFSTNRIMEPLSSHKSDLLILKNVTFSGTGDHKTGMPFSTTGFPVSNQGISIDQEVAAAVGKRPDGGTIPALVLCGQAKGQNYRGYVSQDRSGAWVPPVQDPKTAFQTVFGAPTGGGGPLPPPPGAGGYGEEVERKILDTAMADIDDVRKQLPAPELVKMDAHLDALVNLRKSIVGPGGAGGGPVTPVDCKSAGGDRFAAGGFDYPKRIQLHIELMVAAFACDVRRVASLMTAPGGHDSTGFGFLGIGGEIHNTIAHPSGMGDAGAVEKMAKIGVWEAEQLAYLVKRLKETNDATGARLFDSTVILWTTECMAGNHGHRNIPVVIIGSGGGTLNTGRLIEFAQSPKYTDVLISVARAAGHAGLTAFGESSTGPLAELHR